MSTTLNKQWQLASRPSGEATADNFRLVETPLPRRLNFHPRPLFSSLSS